VTSRPSLQFAICNLQFAIAFLLGIVAVSPSSAAPPTFTSVSPRGAQRGKTVEITVTGANLTSNTRLLLPFAATQKYLPEKKPDPAQVRFQLMVDPAVPLGIYPIRVATDAGVSSLIFFSIDAFPNIQEVENNDTFETAQKVSIPVIISGQCAGGDVDHYRFTAKRGQRVVVETEAARLGSGVSPQLRVLNAQKRFIGSDDTQLLRGDCRVVFVAPADGDYLVEFADTRYKGGNPPDYRLKIGEYDVVEEVFPLGGRRGETIEFMLRGGTLSSDIGVKRLLQAPPDGTTMLVGLDGHVKIGMLSPRIAVGDLPERVWIKTPGKDPKAFDVLPPITINSRLERKGDTDRFQFPVRAGQRYRITVQAQSLGSHLDGVLRVTDQAGNLLAQVDDVELVPADPTTGRPPINGADPAVDIAVPSGTSLLRVELRDQRRRGGVNFGYRLTVEPTVPDFALLQPVSEINVPRGGSAGLTVPVVRRGYAGPIRLNVLDLPPGISVQGGHIPANATAGIFTLTASPQASAMPALLRIEGSAISEGKEVRRHAVRRIVLSQEARAGTGIVTLTRFMLGLMGAEPFQVKGPAEIEVVLGYSTAIPVTITRAKEQMAVATEVTGTIPQPPPPPGQTAPAPPLMFKPGTAAAGTNQAIFTVAVPVNAPEGTADFIVQGKAKINNADRVVFGPAVAVHVVRPFTVELLTPSLTFVAGQTVALKGRLQRRPVFKEAVQLRLDGLPAGVSMVAPPRPVAGDWTEFQIDLKVEPKAAAASANLTLTCTATIAGTPYGHPAISIPTVVKPGK